MQTLDTVFNIFRLDLEGFMTDNHTHNVNGVWITDGMPLSNGHNRSLIVVLLQVNDTLDSPVNSERTFQNQSAVNLSGLHLEALIVEKLVVGLELGFELRPRDGRSWGSYRCWSDLLAETLVRLNSSAVAEELWTEKGSVTWNMAVGDLKSEHKIVTSGSGSRIINDLRPCARHVGPGSVFCRTHGTEDIQDAS